MPLPRIARFFAIVPAAGLAALALASSAGADPRVPTAQDAENKVAANGRTLDQMSNPDYLARQAQALEACAEGFTDVCFLTDPYRLDWAAQGRGRVHPVSWENRYGVSISGHLWAPPGTAGSAADPALPAVLVVNGGEGIEQQYLGLAQGLAEAGYLVLTFDPQCHGSRSGCAPEPEYCDPDGSWREQELGMREHGACAGKPPGAEEDAVGNARHIGICLGTGECDQQALRDAYPVQSPPQVLGALDALDWLLSDANPWRALVDTDRLGIAGHSLGAHAALVAGNGDPRFAAAVAWDGYGVLPKVVSPRIPTLFQRADHDEFGVRTMTPDPEAATPLVNARQFAAAGVPTGHVALGGGSTHQEWAYTPFFGAAFADLSVASRDGERVALHYTLAWFDRFLGGPARDARERLMGPVFDDSADRSSIGQGTYDLLEQRNVPYTVGGETTAEHLSQLHPSWISLPELTCGDLRQGCVLSGRPEPVVSP